MDREKKAKLRKVVYGTLNAIKKICLLIVLYIATWYICYAAIYLTHQPLEVSEANVDRFKKECIITEPYTMRIGGNAFNGERKSIKSMPKEIVGEWEYDKYLMDGDSFSGFINKSSYSASIEHTQNINELRKEYLDWKAKYNADDYNIYLWAFIICCGLFYFIRKFFIWLNDENATLIY